MRCFDSVTNTKKDPLLAGAKLADLHLEGEGVGELVALAGQALTGLRAQLHEAELRERLARPVDGTLRRRHGVLRAAAVVLLITEALAEAAVAHAGAEVDGAQHGGAADVVPVRVLRGTLAAVGALHDFSAVWHEDLAFLLEVTGGRLDPAPRADILQGRALLLADAADLVLRSSHVWLLSCAVDKINEEYENEKQTEDEEEDGKEIGDY